MFHYLCTTFDYATPTDIYIRTPQRHETVRTNQGHT